MQSFNTSLVRLAPAVHPALSGGGVSFNTSLVRLAPRGRLELAEHPTTFQYQLGSIGARPRTSNAPGAPTFQYQLGSIGAEIKDLAGLVHITVSIPAWFDWRPQPHLLPLQRLPRFNTSLVRLALATARDKASATACFNTSLVRLAPTTGGRRATPISVSIPAWFDWRHLPVAGPVVGELRFNTSLVRLAPRSHCAGFGRPGRFQYQLGSIGAWRYCASAVDDLLVSIPAWFDWRVG